MNKLEKILSSKFSKSNFVDLILHLFDVKNSSFEVDENDEFKSAFFKNRSIEIQFLVYETESIHRRSELYREIQNSDVFDDFQVALVGFYNPEQPEIWRLSLIEIDLENRNNFKKMSYILGENQKIKTPLNQISNISKNPNFDDLISAFSVEQLTKEFYSHVFKFFENLQEKIVFPAEDTNNQYFAVRLIGRLLFLKFLEQKNIIPSKTFNICRELSPDCSESNYYHDVLEPLFFETLNKPNNNTQIPYLNGGLFQQQKHDYYGNEFLNTLKVPDEVFSEFFENLQNYNFTIDENSTNEIEVSLDPELLGLVFENLLASINPETSETARKMSGSYYTPRQVVDFMVESSLFNFLKNNTQIDEIKLQQLIFKNSSDNLDFSEKIDILKYLNKIKIFDPAVGSGAFPMGILNKIVEILQTIDYSGEDWFKLQSSEFKTKHKNRDPDYIRKLSIIENSIFGSDIQPIAIEISKLRFFLSLVIEEKDISKIEPLPNLEFKFISANSILPLFEKRPALNTPRYYEIQEEIRDVTKNYFFTSDKTEKEQLKSKFNELKTELNSELDLDFENNFAEFDPFELTHTTPFFDANLMFNVSNGFDIVIGNPPYIRQEKIKHLKDRLKKSDYESFNGTADIYIYFYELGLKNLSETGVLSFITSNKWTRAKYGKNFRKLVLEKTQILEYIDFNGVKVFENATVDTSIISFSKRAEKSQKKSFIFAEITAKLKLKERLFDFVEKSKSDYLMSDLSDESFSFANPEELKIKKKIEKVGTPLKNWDIKINYGIKTGLNEAFIVDSEKKEEILNLCTSSEERTKTEAIFKKLLRGRDIKRYDYKWADLWLIYIPWDFKIDEFPEIKSHLNQFYDKLAKRPEVKAGRYNWYALSRYASDYFQEFEKEKIVWAELTDKNKFTIESEFYSLAGVFFMTGKHLKYLLAFLNSKVIGWHFPFICNSSGVGTNQWKKVFVENLHIPKPTEKTELVLSGLVDYILFAKEHGKNEISQLIESVIDSVVFDIYFEDSMKKAECYILDRLAEKLRPFQPEDTTELKLDYIDSLFNFFSKDKNIQRSLIYSYQLVDEVKIIAKS